MRSLAILVVLCSAQAHADDGPALPHRAVLAGHVELGYVTRAPPGQ
jgi:hypothetical protein